MDRVQQGLAAVSIPPDWGEPGSDTLGGFITVADPATRTPTPPEPKRVRAKRKAWRKQQKAARRRNRRR